MSKKACTLCLSESRVLQAQLSCLGNMNRETGARGDGCYVYNKSTKECWIAVRGGAFEDDGVTHRIHLSVGLARRKILR